MPLRITWEMEFVTNEQLSKKRKIEENRKID